MLNRIREVLGEERARTFHSHFSKIQFTPNGGEKMHLTFDQEDFGPDPESRKKTTGYILAACQAADWMGAKRVVIHSGALMKRTRREAMDIAMPTLKEVLTACDGEGYGHISLCPETMGKINQLGDLDEVLELCTLDERLTPCVDCGHLYARTLG